MASSRATVPPSSLPDPLGGQLEVSFRRLLESCHTHLQALDAAAAATASTSGSSTAATAVDGGVGGGAGGGGRPQEVVTQEAATAAGATTTTTTTTTTTSRRAAGGESAADDSDRAARVLKMRHYVDTLRELLADLREQQDALGLTTATLDLYDTHVKAVAAAVPKVQLPPYCQNLITGSATAPSLGPGGGAGVGGSRPTPNLSYFTPPPARPGVTPSSTAAKGGPAGRGTEVGGLSAAAAERLREAEAAQALLTDELAGLTSALKANALGMAGAVADRGKLLDATDAALSDSLAATRRNVATAGERVRSSRGTLCLTCMVLLGVGLLFTAMVVYIKFTHLMGYRATTAAYVSGGSAGSGGWLGGGGGAGAGAGGGSAHGAGGGRSGVERVYDGGSGFGGAQEPAYKEGDAWQGHGGEL